MNPVSLTPIEREEKINSIHAEVTRLHAAIIRATELAIISTTPEGIITSFNKAAEKLTGFSAIEVIGKVTPTTFHDHIELLERAAEINDELGVELEPNFATFIVRLQSKDAADRADWTYIRKDKVRLPVSVSVAPLWEKELLIGYVFIATDITERKKIHRIQEEIQPQPKESEEELRRLADENSRIFNNSITMTALATFDGYFKRLNPAWERTLGWSRDELVTRPFMSFLHPDDVSREEEIMKVIRTGHTVTMSENRYRCKDGSYRWLLWGYSPDLARKIIYATAIDITARKRSEEEVLLSKRNLEVAAFELEEQNRQLDEFAHIISHNLRAPVANIKALLNFLNDGSQVSDYQLIFEKIRNVTHNIGETMNELLETIKIKKNQEIERVEIRFKDTLAKVVQSLEGELIESGATVTYNFNNAPKVYYSKPYLESILQNLISNAIKYRSPNRIPEIFVSTDLGKNGIELRVQDNGLGIDLEKFGKKLFGLHKTFHGNEEAKGVGLFLTKTQIETLGGTIMAESQVDKGTTFIIQF
jgi:PAS domain S-box-containing protein